MQLWHGIWTLSITSLCCILGACDKHANSEAAAYSDVASLISADFLMSASRAAPIPAGSPQSDAWINNSRVVTQLSDYRAAVAKARSNSSEKNLCSVLNSAEHMQATLGSAVEKLMRYAMVSPRSSTKLNKLSARVETLGLTLTGIGIGLGAETVYHFVDYEALASLAPPSSGFALTLHVAAEIWPTPAGRPVFVEQITDVEGCINPEALVRPLDSVAQRWALMPSCLREHLRTKLHGAIETIKESSNYCVTAEEARSVLVQLTEASRLLDTPRRGRHVEKSLNE